MIVNFHGNLYMDWNYKTEPEPIACQSFPEKKCIWPRGKVLGGCSTINGMMYIRGTPQGKLCQYYLVTKVFNDCKIRILTEFSL